MIRDSYMNSNISNILRFHCRQQHIDPLPLKANDSDIKPVTMVNFLRILFDNCLSWKPLDGNVIAKFSSV